MAYSNRDQFWFGTELYAGWFRSPLRGFTAGAEGWSEGGSLLGGGGWQVTSRGSHKVYQWEWKRTTPYAYAQKMKSYYDGSYGRGLIYFLDPMTYGQNILPAQWADPSIALDGEGAPLVYGVEPTSAATPSNTNGYPVLSATYNLDITTVGWRGREDAVFLPIPEGYTLLLGAQYTPTGSAGVFYRTSTAGTLGTETSVPSEALNGYVASTIVSGVPGVWVYVGKSSSGPATITLRGMTARLMPTAQVDLGQGYGNNSYGTTPYGGITAETLTNITGPWVGGMGHSGCRFMSPPTFESTGPLNGGQAAFAASFREVGSFAY